MKGIIHSFFSLQLLTVFSVGSLLAQSPSEMITRDQYLDKLEERFRDATTELNEISGIKFDVPESSLSQTGANLILINYQDPSGLSRQICFLMMKSFFK